MHHENGCIMILSSSLNLSRLSQSLSIALSLSVTLDPFGSLKPCTEPVGTYTGWKNELTLSAPILARPGNRKEKSGQFFNASPHRGRKMYSDHGPNARTYQPTSGAQTLPFGANPNAAWVFWL